MNLKNIYCATNEYHPLVVDRFERVPSLLANKYAAEPVLSQLLQANGFIPKYKDGKQFGVCISHDIDFLFEMKNRNAFLLSTIETLRRRQWDKFSYNLKNLTGKTQNPDWVLETLIELEHKHNIKSTYYFLALEPGEEDFNYHIDSQKKYFDILDAAGCEIGLHGGHCAYSSLEKIASEKQKLESAYGKKVTGYRNHYLRFSTPNTWHYLQQLGFAYDTTFGFPDQLGYRNGLCYPFRPYDVEKNAFIDILELPLLVMDVTFFKYMGLNVENAFTLFSKIFAEVRKLNGVLTIVWHNNCLAGEYRQLYDKIMADVISHDEAWITTSAEMANWWTKTNLPAMEAIVKDKILVQ